MAYGAKKGKSTPAGRAAFAKGKKASATSTPPPAMGKRGMMPPGKNAGEC